MNSIVAVIVAITVAAVGCWLSIQFIPAGMPRNLAELLSVVAGFGVIGGNQLWGPR